MAQEIAALPENENSASNPHINHLTTAYNSSSWESDPSSGLLRHPHARDIHIQDIYTYALSMTSPRYG